jgi:hypothetical protein
MILEQCRALLETHGDDSAIDLGRFVDWSAD